MEAVDQKKLSYCVIAKARGAMVASLAALVLLQLDGQNKIIIFGNKREMNLCK